MLPSKDIALDILGLPSFATVNEIVLRYKVLSLMWFPENHHNHEFALQEFGNISEAAVKLIFPEKSIGRKLTLPEMYGFFNTSFLETEIKKENATMQVMRVKLLFVKNLMLNWKLRKYRLMIMQLN
ncbi:TPR_REGION domain-containing protein [Caerostris extrusa]|uniref:TPR_REGION domain-containing protein n=1 Tax=Caerostris extrusa TaxID=172846 RepID=A0AAV4R1I5_CAEEX|nr:TPR_REGION domain-containing protein [Caerostris extrusa]